MSAIGPKQTWALAPHMSAFGGKDEMTMGRCLLLRSLLGVKRTCRFALHMSASDPKRTCLRPHPYCYFLTCYPITLVDVARSWDADMRRREFIWLLGGGAFAWPVATLAQQIEHVRRIGIIMNYAEADGEGQERLSVLRDRLNKLGWTPGKNIQIEVRWAAGEPDRMRAQAAELISIPVDVLVGNGTPLLKALKTLTQTIPIVFAQVADPARTGLVS